MSKSSLLTLSLLIAVSFVTACSDNESPPVDTSPPYQGEIAGIMSGVLGRGRYDVVDTLVVQSADTLVIEAGVTLAFSRNVPFIVQGVLIAKGTDTDRITFTSADQLPRPGDWGGLRFQDPNGLGPRSSVLRFCAVEYAGPGIKSELCSLEIRDCRIRFNNYRDFTRPNYSCGGGLHLMHSKAVITNNEIVDNLAHGDGGGIYAVAFPRGYGLYEIEGFLISGNHIARNAVSDTTSFRGGGVYCAVDDAAITDNVIEGNRAGLGGGLSLEGRGLVVRNNLISANHAAIRGGGLAAIESYVASQVEISENDIRSNISPDGGGLFLGGEAVVAGNRFEGNSAEFRGGAISSSGWTSEIVDNHFSENSAPAGAGVYRRQYYATSGYPDIVRLRVANNIFQANVAATGGVVETAGVGSSPESRDVWAHNNTFVANSGSSLFAGDDLSLVFVNNVVLGNSGSIVLDTPVALIAYNAFWPSGAVHFAGASVPAGLGVLASVNDDGHPCDEFFNLISDPMLHDPQNGNYCLANGSPCLKAGDPDEIYRGPDGTRADIGTCVHEAGERR